MFKHLLVPLDGSDISEQALPPALTIAASFGSRVTLLRVVTAPYMIGGYGSDFAEPHNIFFQNRHQEAQTYIKEKVSSLQARGYAVNGFVVLGDSTAAAILDVAERFAVDTIVMGTHGRGGLSRWLLGSVANKVLRCSAAPVLLIPTLTRPCLLDELEAKEYLRAN